MGASTGGAMSGGGGSALALAGGANPYVAAGTAALGAGMGIYNAIQEASNKRKLAAEIAKQQAVPLTNIADGLQVSTLGSDLQKQQQSQLATNQSQALQEGGARAIIGGQGAIAQNSNLVNQQIAADLDAQQKNIDMIGANDAAAIRGIKENRANAKLAALSSQYNAANQNQNQAMGNIVQGVGSAGVNLVNAGGYAGNPNAVGNNAAYANYFKNKQV